MNKWICVGEATVLNLDNITDVTKQADHLLFETSDGKVIEVVYNSEPEARDAIMKIINLLGVTTEVGGEIITDA